MCCNLAAVEPKQDACREKMITRTTIITVIIPITIMMTVIMIITFTFNTNRDEPSAFWLIMS